MIKLICIIIGFIIHLFSSLSSHINISSIILQIIKLTSKKRILNVRSIPHSLIHFPVSAKDPEPVETPVVYTFQT